MPCYLILRLDGPLQAWGTHTFEDFRPSNLFPTRSGLLGLLGACLGIERDNHTDLEQLASSVEFTVRIDQTVCRPGVEEPVPKTAIKLPDFHTVLDARKVDGTVNKNPVISRREYLFDAAFTVAVGQKPNATITLSSIAEALRRPCFTPVLGRRACPITSPLLNGKSFEASNPIAALAEVRPVGGLIYAEGDCVSLQPIWIRDVPMQGHQRRFATRLVYLHKEESCS